MNNAAFKYIFFLATALMLAAGQNLFAQTEAGSKRIAVYTGPEFNMNSRENFAGRVSLGLDFSLPSHPMAIGVEAAGSYNFSNAVVIEAEAFFRWYFPGKRHTGFFAQAEAGLYYIMENMNGFRDKFPMFLGGLRAGYRLPLGQSFFIEPYVRGGYPFVFGIGVLAGIRFWDNK